MRLNLKKVSAIAASALMVGLTMGSAVAANYPDPFVVGGAANVAVVYGTGSGVSSLDLVQASNIQSNLQSYMGGTSSTGGVSATGEFIKFEKEGIDKLNIGDNLTDIISIDIDDDDLPTVLADGTYSNSDSEDYDYRQKINLPTDTLQFGLFADNDYKDKDPTLGIKIAKSKPVLNYTLDFTQAAEDDTNSGDDFDDYEDTTISFLGKSYDIITATNTSASTKLTMMGGSEKDTLNLNEAKTYTVEGVSYDVELTYVDNSDYCKFTVNGESTDKILKGGTDKLSDGTYIGVADVDYSTGAVTEIIRCKFYIGADKIELEDTKDVKVNDDDIDNLKVFWDETNGNPFKLNKMILEWKADDDLFVTEDNDVSMPEFGSVKLSSGGLTASEYEVTKIRGSSNDNLELTTTLKSGEKTIELLGSNNTGGWTDIGGRDDADRLVTANGSSAEVQITYNLSTSGNGTQYFVATYYDGDKTGSSYLIEVSDADDEDGVDFRDVISGATLEENIGNDTDFEIGDATFRVCTFEEDNYVDINISGSNAYFDRIVTDAGLVIHLPVDYNRSGASESPWINLSVFNGSKATGPTPGEWPTSYIIYMEEENKDGTLGSGSDINITAQFAGTDRNVEAVLDTTADNVCNVVDGTNQDLEDQDDDNAYICYVQSELGTKIIYDSDPDEDTVDIYYPGEQSYGNIFLSEVSSEITTTAVTPGGQLGDVLVKDSEISSVSSKNLIVVGGSCINSVAANLVGEPACSADFTTKTGIGSGQFLIESFGDAYTTGKIALLVAGYEAADTVNAATYLRTQTVDTTAGKKYKGTSSTSAELVVE